MREQIILVGGGGHAKSVIDAIKGQNQYDIVGILDVSDKLGEELEGIKVIGVDEDLHHYYQRGVKNAFITLGSVGNPTLRIKLYNRVKSVGYRLPNIIDKSAIIAQSVQLGEGCFIGKAAIINSGSIIGNNTIINTGSLVEHDCAIGSFVHLAPRSTICGSVKIADNTHVGVNTTVIQGITIGKGSLIGAGSIVLKDIGDAIKAYGCPCKEVGRFE